MNDTQTAVTKAAVQPPGSMIQTVHSAFAAFNKGDMEELATYFDDDVVLQNVLDTNLFGKESVMAYYRTRRGDKFYPSNHMVVSPGNWACWARGTATSVTNNHPQGVEVAYDIMCHPKTFRIQMIWVSHGDKRDNVR